MDQTHARRLAKRLGGIATQESRYKGQWPKPDEPWVVVAHGRTYREVPDPEFTLYPGDRIEVTGTMINDPAPMEIGARGTVEAVYKDVHQVWVKWDNGRTLMLVIPEDLAIVRIVEDE